MNEKYKELERQLLENKISTDEFIKRYNELIDKEQEKYIEPFEPHEHI